MKQFILYEADDLHAVSGYGHDHFESCENPPPLNVQITTKNNGTLPMLNLWRMWMADIAKFQAERGAVIPIQVPETQSDGSLGWKVIGYRRYDEKDAHEAYTHLLLGADENGVRLSWAVYTDQYEGRKVASISQKLHAMQKFHQFCIEHGVPIRIPRNSEYQELQDKQDGIK
ncbi:hypothetical protein ABKY54_004153 [Vibrio harveyi]